MDRRTRALVILATPALLLAAGGPASGQAGRPEEGLRFWTWRKPPAELALPHVEDATIIPMMRRAAGVVCSDPTTHCCEGSCGCVQRTPASVVESIEQELEEHADLYKGEVCLMLQEAGQGDGNPCPDAPGLSHIAQGLALFQHWCDAVDAAAAGDCESCPPPDPAGNGWITPWMSAGTCESRAWMDGFVAEYLQRQGAGELPAPVRLHLDTEIYPVTWWQGGADAVQTFLGIAGLAVWGQRPDPRWDTEIIGGTGQTLGALYDAARDAGMDQPILLSWNHPYNQEWSRWYDGLVLTACDAAMDGGFYEPAEQAWPEIGTSNLLTSVRVDGASWGPGTPPRLLRTRVHAAADWYRLQVVGSSNMQAPEFYPVSDQNVQEGETPGQATVRVHRANTEACLGSFGGYPADRFVPWISHVGVPFKIYQSSNDLEYVVTKSDMRALLAMLRGEGVREFLSWVALTESSDPDWIENWQHADDLIDQVWGAAVDGYELATADTSGAVEAPPGRLSLSDWSWSPDAAPTTVPVPAVPTGTPEGPAHVGTLTVDFESSFACGDTGRLDVIVDGRLAGDFFDARPPVAVTVSLFNWSSGEWDQIDAAAPSAAGYANLFDPDTLQWQHVDLAGSGGIALDVRRQIVTVTDIAAWRHIDGDGAVRVRLELEDDEPFTANIDMVQLLASDEGLPGGICRADCHPPGGDGIVDIDDVVAIIAAWGTTSGPCDVGPGCGDGVVGIDDLVEAIVGFGPCE